MSLRPGLRVVRGPDWKWKDQDGGAGHVGTVVSFGDGGTQGDCATRVNVKWDRGLLGDYRMGFENAFDLRILDNGSVGDHHAEVQCNGCNLSPIHGMRWCCAALDNYDLCSKCYHEGRNFTEYRFSRILIPGAKGDTVPPRQGSTVSEVKGLFPGAKVKLWTGHPSDPNDERRRKRGEIVRLCDWKEGYTNTGAVVDWPLDEHGTHCIGFEGKMDLRTKESASGGFYYLDHLPILGKAIKMEVVEGLVVGSHVTIDLPRELLMDLQQGHGEWVEGMEEDIRHIGVVRDWTNERDAIVEFPRRRKKWIFHPAALTKYAGSLAGVTTGDGPNDQCASDSEDEERQDSIGMLAVVKRVTLPDDTQEQSEGADIVAIKAAEGGLQEVKALLRRHPSWVNSRHEEKTPLQLAAYRGFLDVAQALVVAGADLEVRDEDGDTALMFAVIGNKPEVLRFLIERGADINVVSNERRSALHQAVSRGFTECANILLDCGCDINIKDKFDDTALHDAVAVRQGDIMELLINNPAVNMRQTNKRKYNPVQWAALKGNQYAITLMIAKDPDMAGVPNAEGFTPLHIAAMNNYPDIVRILIVKGSCNVNALTQQQHAPLRLAVGAGHVEVVETLLNLGANANITDADGDTSLHVALLRQVIYPEVHETVLLEKIKARIPDQSVATSGLALACLLVEHGANLQHVNNNGHTPLQLVPDNKICAALRHFVPRRKLQGAPSTDRQIQFPSGAQKPQSSKPESPHIEMQQQKMNFYQRPAAAAATPKSSRQSNENRNPSTSVTPEQIRMQREKERFLQEEYIPQQRTDIRGSKSVGGGWQNDGEESEVQPREHIARQREKEAKLCTPDTSPLPHPSRAANIARFLPQLTLPRQGTPEEWATPEGPTPTPTPTPTQKVLQPNLARCWMPRCTGRVADAQFLPCNHISVCLKCSELFKRCPECRAAISDVQQLGRIDSVTNADPSMGQQRAPYTDSTTLSRMMTSEVSKSFLIMKIKKYREELECSLCMSNRKDCVLLCGHRFCEQCLNKLLIKECPNCRVAIQKIIKVY